MTAFNELQSDRDFLPVRGGASDKGKDAKHAVKVHVKKLILRIYSSGGGAGTWVSTPTSKGEQAWLVLCRKWQPSSRRTTAYLRMLTLGSFPDLFIFTLRASLQISGAFECIWRRESLLPCTLLAVQSLEALCDTFMICCHHFFDLLSTHCSSWPWYVCLLFTVMFIFRW